MPEPSVKRALISVWDKSGLADFARALQREFATEIIATGRTAQVLHEAGVAVTPIERITGFPELLDGRVKTLHPAIHAAILADRDNPAHMQALAEQGIQPIDLVVVNLYPFAETVADAQCSFERALEMIDIGGPCLLRAAAKNHRHVLVVSQPEHYHYVRKALCGSPEAAAKVRARLAAAAFDLTRTYDLLIGDYLQTHLLGGAAKPSEHVAALLPQMTWTLEKQSPLRYGENPHQAAGLYRTEATVRGLTSVPGVMASQAASFNNYLDADAAFRLCRELTREWRGPRHNCVFVKHTNPCGVGVADDPVEAYRRAYLGDPQAAMGGILACNFAITPEFAGTVMETFDRWGKSAGAGGFFVEVWLAPHFEREAVRVIESAKPWGERVRLLVDKELSTPGDDEGREYRSIKGGLLVQTRDLVGLNEQEWTWVSSRRPSEREMDDLRLAWLVCKHTHSNAISICKDGRLIGNGAGQMSRVMSCRVAAWLARENGHAEALAGAAAASDAFFPFADGPQILLEAGVAALIQPGGAKRDGEVLALCNHHDAAVIFTNTRHFKH